MDSFNGSISVVSERWSPMCEAAVELLNLLIISILMGICGCDKG